MKTKEELITLKEEVETLNKKLAELSEEELAQVTGGFFPILYSSHNYEEDKQLVGSGLDSDPVLTK